MKIHSNVAMLSRMPEREKTIKTGSTAEISLSKECFGTRWAPALQRLSLPPQQQSENFLSSTTLDLRDREDVSVENLQDLRKMPQLSNVKLCWVALNEGAVKLFAQIPTLTSLTANDCQIGSKGAAILAQQTALTCLHLVSNKIGKKGYRALFKSASLIDLNLSGNKKLVCKKALTALATNTSISKLTLRLIEASDKVARAAAKAVGLIELDLSHNLISDKGMTALMLHSGMRSLRLNNNKLLCAARIAAHNSTLRTLDVSGNKLVSETENWSSNQTLTTLFLEDTGNVDWLAASTRPMTQLQSLSLRHTPVTLAALAALSHFPALTRLDLMHSTLEYSGSAYDQDGSMLTIDQQKLARQDETRAQLALIASQFPALRELNLSHNIIINQVIATQFLGLPTLTSIDLSGTDVSDCKALSTLAASRSLSLKLDKIVESTTTAACSLSNMPTSFSTSGFLQMGMAESEKNHASSDLMNA